MELSDVRVERAQDIEHALRLKAQHGERGVFVAGGTDLLLQVRSGKRRPEVLIGLPAVAPACVVQGGVLKVPAMATIASLLEKGGLGGKAPLLALALSQIGSPLVRNVATLGGNLGNASPAADSVPALVALDACVVLASVRGQRTLPVEDLFAGPGRTVLAPDEAIVELEVPVSGGAGGDSGERCFFRKFGPRRANVISSVSLAARVRMSPDGVVERARLCAGSVGPRPLRLGRTERDLIGLEARDLADAGVLDNVCRVMRGEISPISDVRGSAWYKARVVELSLRSFLESLGGGTGAAGVPVGATP